MHRWWFPSFVVLVLFAAFSAAGAWLERRRRQAEGERRQALPAGEPGATGPAGAGATPPAAAAARETAAPRPAPAARALAETEHP